MTCKRLLRRLCNGPAKKFKYFITMIPMDSARAQFLPGPLKGPVWRSSWVHRNHCDEIFELFCGAIASLPQQPCACHGVVFRAMVSSLFAWFRCLSLRPYVSAGMTLMVTYSLFALINEGYCQSQYNSSGLDCPLSLCHKVIYNPASGHRATARREPLNPWTLLQWNHLPSFPKT